MVYVRHVDPNLTGEGLGSHARGSLYPLLRISLAFSWEILWEQHSGAFGKDNQTRPFYETECRHLGEWLLLSDGGEDKLITIDDLDRKRLTVVNIDLDNDVRLGRILGYAGILISSIQQFIEDNGIEQFYNQRSTGNQHIAASPPIIVISLNGRFQYQDDPSPSVIKWLQAKGQEWRMNAKQNEQSRTSSSIRVVGHIRVPEDYCSQEWKDANRTSHLINALSILAEEWNRLKDELDDKKQFKMVLDIFTEETFSMDNETELLTALSTIDMFDEDSIRINRQTPLLDTVQSMATADIFIPASSYLSAFAGFFHASTCRSPQQQQQQQQPSSILLPEESTRREKYFAPHLKYASTSDGNDDDFSDNAICPIVSSYLGRDLIYQSLKDVVKRDEIGLP
jgi:hypothetical protein